MSAPPAIDVSLIVRTRGRAKRTSTIRASEVTVDGERRLVLDDDLLAAVRQLRRAPAEPSALRALDTRLRPRLLRYFHEPPFTREDAEDLVQKTFLLVFQHAASLAREDRFVGWLFAIARNVKVTERDRRRAEYLVPVGDSSDLAATGVSAGEALLEAERGAALREAIAALPPRQRQCLVLRVRDELSYEEIAEALRLNVLTVRNHLAEAKKTLRRLLAARSVT